MKSNVVTRPAKSSKKQLKKPVSGHAQLLPLMFEMGRLLKSEITRDGVSMPTFLHVETLRFIQDQINEGQEPSMSNLADYLKIAPPSATVLVNTFVKEGVLERVGDPHDRRRVHLALSKKGTRLLEDIMHKREKAFARVIAPLSTADCRELSRILTIITRTS